MKWQINGYHPTWSNSTDKGFNYSKWKMKNCEMIQKLQSFEICKFWQKRSKTKYSTNIDVTKSNSMSKKTINDKVAEYLNHSTN